jgi:hypothetical protein
MSSIKINFLHLAVEILADEHLPFKYEAQTALFKDPVRTAQ